MEQIDQKPVVWPESTCVECGQLIPAGHLQVCPKGGWCNWHVPAAVRERMEEMYNDTPVVSNALRVYVFASAAAMFAICLHFFVGWKTALAIVAFLALAGPAAAWYIAWRRMIVEQVVQRCFECGALTSACVCRREEQPFVDRVNEFLDRKFEDRA